MFELEQEKNDPSEGMLSREYTSLSSQGSHRDVGNTSEGQTVVGKIGELKKNK